MANYPTTLELQNYARGVARDRGIPENLFLGQVEQESSWNPNAIGPETKYGTAKGLLQFVDSTAANPGYGIEGGFDPLDPYVAIDKGGDYLKAMMDKFGDINLAFAAYNAGPGNVEKYGGVPPYAETQNYLKGIEERSAKYSDPNFVFQNLNATSSAPVNEELTNALTNVAFDNAVSAKNSLVNQYSSNALAGNFSADERMYALSQSKADIIQQKMLVTTGSNAPQYTPEQVEKIKASFAEMNNKWIDDGDISTTTGAALNSLFNIGAMGVDTLRVLASTPFAAASTALQATDNNNLKALGSIIEDVFVNIPDSLVDEYFVSKLKQTNVKAFSDEIRQYSDKAAIAFSNGKYREAIGYYGEGLLEAVLNEPAGAVDVFSQSLPMMIAAVKAAALTTAGFTTEYSREILIELEKELGREPTLKERGVGVLAGFFAAATEVFSDRIAAKGVLPLKAGLTKTANFFGVPANSLIRATTKVITSTGYQIAQESLSGASTETFMQLGVKQDLDKLNQADIFHAAALEAGGLAPLYGARAAAASAGIALKGTGKALNTLGSAIAGIAPAKAQSAIQSISDVNEKTRNAVNTVQEAINTEQLKTTNVLQDEDEEPTEDTRDPVTKLTDLIASFVNRPEGSTFTQEEYDTAMQHLTDVLDLIDQGAELDAEDVKFLEEQATIIRGVGVQAGIVEADASIEQVRTVIEQIVVSPESITPEQQAANERVIAQSMMGGYEISIPEAQRLLDSGVLSNEMGGLVANYMDRVQAMDIVAEQVIQGQDVKYRGYTIRAKSIADFIANGQFEKAKAELEKLKNFATYMDQKRRAFIDASTYRPNDPTPSSMKDVTFNDRGYIDQFRVNTELPFNPAQPFYYRHGASQKLMQQIEAEAAILRTLYEDLTNTVAKDLDTRTEAPTSRTEAPSKTRKDKITQEDIKRMAADIWNRVKKLKTDKAQKDFFDLEFQAIKDKYGVVVAKAVATELNKLAKASKTSTSSSTSSKPKGKQPKGPKLNTNPKTTTINAAGSYGSRTDFNASIADLTIAFANDFTTSGEKRTRTAANKANKPIVSNENTSRITFIAKIVAQLAQIKGNPILNFAGNSLYNWAQQKTTGSYEVSSKGDKRFSALHAKLKDGRTIEQAWAEAKGYANPQEAKNKPAKTKDFKYWDTYVGLWKQWARENPDLLRDLANVSRGKKLTDSYAKTENNQAAALTEILTQHRVNLNTYATLQGVAARTKIKALVSGGQSGSDIAGIVAARVLGIPTTINMATNKDGQFIQRNIHNKDVVVTAEEIEQQIQDGVAVVKEAIKAGIVARPSKTVKAEIKLDNAKDEKIFQDLMSEFNYSLENRNVNDILKTMMKYATPAQRRVLFRLKDHPLVQLLTVGSEFVENDLARSSYRHNIHKLLFPEMLLEKQDEYLALQEFANRFNMTKAEMLVNVVMHETLHAVTSNAFYDPNNPETDLLTKDQETYDKYKERIQDIVDVLDDFVLTERFEKLSDYVKNRIQYMRKSPAEMATVALTEPDVMAVLDTVHKSHKDKRSVLDYIVEAVRELIGLKPKDDTLLQEIMQLSFEIIQFNAENTRIINNLNYLNFNDEFTLTTYNPDVDLTTEVTEEEVIEAEQSFESTYDITADQDVFVQGTPDYLKTEAQDGTKNGSIEDYVILQTGDNINELTVDEELAIAFAENNDEIIVDEGNVSLSVFTQFKNFFANLRNGKISINLNNRDHAHLQTISDFVEVFSTKYRNTYEAFDFNKRTNATMFNGKPEKINRYDSDPFLYFLNITADYDVTIDDNVLAALAVSGLDYLSGEAKAYVNNKDRNIRSILGLPDGWTPSEEAYALLAKGGVPATAEAIKLGKNFLRGLNLRKNNNSTVPLAGAKLELAAGLAILQVLEEMGYLETNAEITAAKLKEAGSRIDYGKDPVFIKINEEAIAPLQSAAVHGLQEVVEGLFNTQKRPKYPSFRKNRKRIYGKSTTMNGQRLLNQREIKALNNAESQPWNFNPDLQKYLEEGNVEFMRNLLGWTDPDTVPMDVRERTISQNSLKDAEIQGLLEFYNIAKANNFRDFYFSYGTQRNNRHRIKNNNFNPQDSKLVRHFVIHNTFKTTIDMSNADSEMKYSYAVAQAFGFDIDKEHPSKTIKFAKNITRTKQFKELKKHYESGDQISLARALSKYSEPAFALHGLETVLRRQQAGKKPFPMSLPIEADAVTNGIALGLLVTGIGGYEAEMREATGVFTDGSFETYQEWRSTKGSKDNYEILAASWGTAFNKWITALKKSDPKKAKQAIELFQLIGKPDRAMAKDPVMFTGYGAGTDTVVEAFARNRVVDILSSTLDPNVREQLGLVLNMNLSKWNPLEQRLNHKHIQRLNDLVIEFYGEVLRNEVNAHNTLFKEQTKRLNQTINLVAWVFMAKYRQVVKSELKKLGLKNEVELNPKQRKEIMESPLLRPFLPMFKTAFAQNRTEGYAAIKTVKTNNPAPVTQVRSRFNSLKTKNGTRGKNGNVATYEFKEPGVSGLVGLTHSLDSAILAEAMIEAAFLPVFDAELIGVDSANPIVGFTNGKIYEITKDYSFVDTIESTLKVVLKTLEKQGGVDSLRGFWDTVTDQHPLALAKFGEPTRPKGSKPRRYAVSVFFEDVLNGFQEAKFIEADYKERLFNDITHVHNMVGMPESTYKVPKEDNFGGSVESLTTQVVEEMFNSDPDTEMPNDFVADSMYDITEESVIRLAGMLENMGPVQNTEEHKVKLYTLLDSLVKKVLNRIGPLQAELQAKPEKGAAWLKDKKITMRTNSGLQDSNVEQSSLELYSHELVHAITEAGLADPSNTLTIRQIQRLQKEVKDALNRKYNGEGWKAFLKKDGHGNPIYLASELDEVNAAKRQFNYIFEDTTPKTVRYLDENGRLVAVTQPTALIEFISYGLTNEHINNELEGIDFTIGKLPEAPSFFGKLEQLFYKILDRLGRKVGRIDTLTADKALLNLVADISHAHTKRTFSTQKVMNGLHRGNSAVRREWVKHIAEPLGRLNWKLYRFGAKRSLRNGSFIGASIAATAVGIGLVLPPVGVTAKVRGQTVAIDPDIFIKSIENTRRRLHRAKRGIVYDLIRLIVGTKDPYMQKLEWMQLESKNVLDTPREEMIDNTRSLLREGFLNELSLSDLESFSMGTMATDLSVLVDDLNSSNYRYLISMLKNTGNARSNEIDRLVRELRQYGREGNYYINQARSLGHYMSTGEALVEQQGSNAWVIANGTMLDESMFNKPSEVEHAELLIDKLATLYAIQYGTTSNMLTTANIIEQEFRVNANNNGAILFMRTHKAFKEQSFNQNFDNNKAMIRKGYMKQVFDPTIDVRVGYLSDEAEMLRNGYVRQEPVLAVDPIDVTGLPDNRARYLYVNTAGGVARYEKTILSMTSEQVQGSSVRNGKLGDQNPDNYLVAASQVRQMKELDYSRMNAQFASHTYQNNEDKLLVPSVDERGRVYDYRYVMNQHTRTKILKQRLDATDLLARMHAEIVDKVRSQEINNKAIDAMYEDYRANYSRIPADFTLVSADSRDTEAAEMWRMLPEKSKIRVQQKFGNTFYVRTEALTILFGKRKFQLSKTTTPRILRLAEKVWKEVVSYSKLNIVVKNPAVISGNIASNTVLGTIRGVPIEEMLKGQIKGIRLLQAYQKDARELNQLNIKALGLKAVGQPTADLERRMDELKALINNSEIKPLIDAGLFTTVVEDVDVKPSEGYASTYLEKLESKLPKYLRSGESGLREVVDWSLLTRDTGAFKLLMKSTQYSDFVARYAVYNHLTKNAPANQRKSKEEAKRIVLEMFVNYEFPMNKYLQYMDEMGLFVFIKYPMKIIRALYSAFKNNPLNFLGLGILESTLDVAETPFDASYAAAWSIDRGLGLTVDSATTPASFHWIP